MNKFLKYGAIALVTAMSANVSAYIGEDLWKSMKSLQGQNSARADLGPKVTDRGLITADAKHGKAIFDLLFSADSTCDLGSEDVGPDGGLLLLAAINDLVTTKSGAGKVWTQFVSLVNGRSGITSKDQLLYVLKEQDAWIKKCKRLGGTLPLTKAVKVPATGGVWKGVWDLMRLNPSAAQRLLAGIYALGGTLTGASGEKEAKTLANYLLKAGYDLDELKINGHALFVDSTQGSEKLNHEVINSLYDADEGTCIANWSKALAFCLTDGLTYSELSTAQQIAVYTTAAKGSFDGPAAVAASTPDPRLIQLERENEVMLTWIQEQGYFYDAFNEEVSKSQY